jgi:hypothetical protein
MEKEELTDRLAEELGFDFGMIYYCSIDDICTGNMRAGGSALRSRNKR